MAEQSAKDPALAPEITRVGVGAGAGVTLRECTARTIVRLEWIPRTEAPPAFHKGFGGAHCPANCSLDVGDIRLLRIGPATLWAVADTLGAEEVAARTAAFAKAADAAMVDVSHGFVALACSGPAIADLLQAGSPADLGNAACPVDAVARTVFDDHAVTINRRDMAAFDVYVDRSLARSFWGRFSARLNAAS